MERGSRCERRRATAGSESQAKARPRRQCRLRDKSWTVCQGEAMSDEPGMALAKLVENAAPEVRAALEATGALDVLRQGVGIVGDRVWLRRQERFAVGLAEAARRLQARGVPLAAI